MKNAKASPADGASSEEVKKQDKNIRILHQAASGYQYQNNEIKEDDKVPDIEKKKRIYFMVQMLLFL